MALEKQAKIAEEFFQLRLQRINAQKKAQEQVLGEGGKEGESENQATHSTEPKDIKESKREIRDESSSSSSSSFYLSSDAALAWQLQQEDSRLVQRSSLSLGGKEPMSRGYSAPLPSTRVNKDKEEKIDRGGEDDDEESFLDGDDNAEQMLEDAASQALPEALPEDDDEDTAPVMKARDMGFINGLAMLNIERKNITATGSPEHAAYNYIRTIRPVADEGALYVDEKTAATIRVTDRSEAVKKWLEPYKAQILGSIQQSPSFSGGKNKFYLTSEALTYEKVLELWGEFAFISDFGNWFDGERSINVETYKVGITDIILTRRLVLLLLMLDAEKLHQRFEYSFAHLSKYAHDTLKCRTEADKVRTREFWRFFFSYWEIFDFLGISAEKYLLPMLKSKCLLTPITIRVMLELAVPTPGIATKTDSTVFWTNILIKLDQNKDPIFGQNIKNTLNKSPVILISHYFPILSESAFLKVVANNCEKYGVPLVIKTISQSLAHQKIAAPKLIRSLLEPSVLAGFVEEPTLFLKTLFEGFKIMAGEKLRSLEFERLIPILDALGEKLGPDYTKRFFNSGKDENSLQVFLKVVANFSFLPVSVVRRSIVPIIDYLYEHGAALRYKHEDADAFFSRVERRICKRGTGYKTITLHLQSLTAKAMGAKEAESSSSSDKASKIKMKVDKYAMKKTSFKRHASSPAISFPAMSSLSPVLSLPELLPGLALSSSSLSAALPSYSYPFASNSSNSSSLFIPATSSSSSSAMTFVSGKIFELESTFRDEITRIFSNLVSKAVVEKRESAPASIAIVKEQIKQLIEFILDDSSTLSSYTTPPELAELETSIRTVVKGFLTEEMSSDLVIDPDNAMRKTCMRLKRLTYNIVKWQDLTLDVTEPKSTEIKSGPMPPLLLAPQMLSSLPGLALSDSALTAAASLLSMATATTLSPRKQNEKLSPRTPKEKPARSTRSNSRNFSFEVLEEAQTPPSPSRSSRTSSSSKDGSRTPIKRKRDSSLDDSLPPASPPKFPGIKALSQTVRDKFGSLDPRKYQNWPVLCIAVNEFKLNPELLPLVISELGKDSADESRYQSALQDPIELEDQDDEFHGYDARVLAMHLAVRDEKYYEVLDQLLAPKKTHFISLPLKSAVYYGSNPVLCLTLHSLSQHQGVVKLANTILQEFKVASDLPKYIHLIRDWYDWDLPTMLIYSSLHSSNTVNCLAMLDLLIERNLVNIDPSSSLKNDGISWFGNKIFLTTNINQVPISLLALAVFLGNANMVAFLRYRFLQKAKTSSDFDVTKLISWNAKGLQSKSQQNGVGVTEGFVKTNKTQITALLEANDKEALEKILPKELAEYLESLKLKQNPLPILGVKRKSLVEIEELEQKTKSTASAASSPLLAAGLLSSSLLVGSMLSSSSSSSSNYASSSSSSSSAPSSSGASLVQNISQTLMSNKKPKLSAACRSQDNPEPTI